MTEHSTLSESIATPPDATDASTTRPDNNASERALRAVAVGRKNWLFTGSDSGGRTAAVFYTMTQSCRRHALDPFVCLQDVLTRLSLSTSDDLPSFLPNRWAAQRASAEKTARSIPRLVADASPRRRHGGSPDAYERGG